MTISSGNMLSTLLTPTDSPTEGLLGAQIQVAATDAESSPELNAEGKFWSMLNQQLTEIVSQDDAQVIDNKDLLAMFEAFEADLEQAGQQTGIPSEWMQFMKSHFEMQDQSTASEVSNAMTETPGAEEIMAITRPVIMDEEAVATVATSPLMEPVAGEELPVMRQVLSAEMPSTSVEQTVVPLKTEGKIEALSLNRAVPNLAPQIAEQQGEIDATPQMDGDSDEVFQAVLEKTGQKQVNAEQLLQASRNDTAALNSKTNDVLTSLQANPALGAQPQAAAQSLASQNLPTALQSLQMTPQAPAAEWGNALGERVSFLINQKLNHAEIRIDPPHLGKLDIQIQVKEDAATIVINTQHAQTRDLIDAASLRLREFLQDAGYSSVDVNVSHREQSMAENAFGNQGDTSDSPGENKTGSEAELDEPVMMSAYVPVDDGRIDYFA